MPSLRPPAGPGCSSTSPSTTAAGAGGGAGPPSSPALGLVLPLVVALADPVTAVPGGAGLLLAAIGVVLVGTAALSRPDPREGLASFATTVFGALYVGLLGFVPRLRRPGPPIP